MGTLYIVSTPIGNLKDITLRAIETLKSSDYILCEDTRITARLLNQYGFKTPMVSFNDFNENLKTPNVIRDLTMGKNIALVSDAGAPLIADPGYKLVREAIAAGIKIESISGPSAVISALTVSSKPPDRFLFLGYLPKKESKRKEILNRIALIIKNFKMTVVFYESPHRLLKTLRNLLEVFGDIDIVVCRELTKLHEEVRRERINSSIEHFSKVSPRGEFTIVL